VKAFDVLQDAWSNRAALGDGAQQRELAAFLPAALEIQESPPNPITRWLAWSLVVLFTLAVIWASFGKVDIVASAEGKIIPSSRVKQIQPLQKAAVQKILVTEGQTVRKGQPLIELDSTSTGADKNRLGGELKNLQLQMAVYTALNKALSQRGDNEGHALSCVLTQGKDSKADYVPYTHNYEIIVKKMRSFCPARVAKRLGSYWLTKVGDKKVLVFKSDSHLSQDTEKGGVSVGSAGVYDLGGTPATGSKSAELSGNIWALQSVSAFRKRVSRIERTSGLSLFLLAEITLSG